MKGDRYKVLLIEDDKVDQMAFRRFIKDKDITYELEIAGSVAEAKDILHSNKFDIVISDHYLGDGTAFDIFNLGLDSALVMITGSGDQDIAVKAMKLGAYDYLIKDSENNHLKVLPTTIENAIRRKRIEEELKLTQFSVNNTSDMVFWVKPTGELLFANEATRQALGYSPDELRGFHLTQIIFNMNNEKFDNFVKDLKTNGSIRLESYHRRKNGAIFPVELQANYKVFNEEEYIFIFARDIADRKRAEERYRSLFDSSPEGIAIIGLDGTIIDYNEAQGEILNLPRDEIIGHTFFELGLIEDDDLNKIVEVFEKTISGEACEPFEIEIGTEAQKVWIEIVPALITTGGEIESILAITRDTTERKVAAEALQKSEEKYRELVEKINDVIYTTNIEGTITFISPGIESITGYSPNEITGKSFMEYIHEDDLPHLLDVFPEVLAGKMRPSEYRIRSKSGELRWVRSYSRPIKENGDVIGLHGLLTDVSDIKEAEEKQKESELKYHRLITNITDTILEIDLDGNFTYLSPQVKDMFGFEPEEVIGQSAFQFIHPDDMDRTTEMFITAMENKERISIEYRCRHKDGHYIPISAHGSLVEKDDEIKLIGIVSDITERKQAEEKVLEERNKAKLYLDLLGHDINNLNQTILSSSELLLLNQELSEKSKKYVENSLKQANAISELILNVRKLSDLKEHEIQLELLDIDIVNIINTSIERLHLVHQNKKIKVTQKIPDSNKSVKGNELLQEVFDNILGNAVKYNKNEEIRIEISCYETDDEKFLKFEIKDNGPGVTDDYKERIFKRLERGDESVHGSGLGLTIVNEIVKNSGGYVWVEDNVKGDSSQGSNFVILLLKGGSK